ncbi:MAG: hypothetical protein PW786_01585 [Arachidicoccus sp.]|nr:hypothetical protein [Arachidicoccus sp.]
MRTIISILLFGFLIIPFSEIAAQKPESLSKDFVVSNEGDTLYGKFKKKLFDAATFVVNGETIPLDPTQYTSYCTKHTLFRSIQLSENTHPQWMECVEDGAICLYQFIFQQNVRAGQPPVGRIIWLAQKKGGPLLNVNGIMSDESSARNNLSALLADKPAIQNDFLTAPFSLKNIRYHIEQYNKTN